MEVVGETRDAGEAIRAIARLPPSGVVVAIDVTGISPVELVARLRESSAEIKVLVFGGEPGCELEIALAGLNVDSFLLWEDVTREAVIGCLYGVLVAGVRLVSPRAVEAVVVNSVRRLEPGQLHLPFLVNNGLDLRSELRLSGRGGGVAVRASSLPHLIYTQATQQHGDRQPCRTQKRDGRLLSRDPREKECQKAHTESRQYQMPGRVARWREKLKGCCVEGDH
ncbi:MAG: hypothetical protein ACRDFS_08540 [Chloroflexota bacterium]